MRFRKERPTKSTRYWYVDKEYPVPMIGFIGGGIFYDRDNHPHDDNSLYADKFIRFGDAIEAPPCAENEVDD